VHRVSGTVETLRAGQNKQAPQAGSFKKLLSQWGLGNPLRIARLSVCLVHYRWGASCIWHICAQSGSIAEFTKPAVGPSDKRCQKFSYSSAHRLPQHTKCTQHTSTHVQHSAAKASLTGIPQKTSPHCRAAEASRRSSVAYTG